MDWLTLIKTAISVGLDAYKAGKVMVREKEAVDGRAVVARLHSGYEAAKADPGLPAGVR